MKEINEISISIYDIVKYLSQRWMFYLAGALLGALIAFGLARSNSIYTATAVLSVHRGFEALPNDLDQSAQQDVPFDMIYWFETQRRLAEFMREFAANKNPSNPAMRDVAASMAHIGWFAHHIAPAKFLPENQAKELLAINSMIIGTAKPAEEKPTLKLLERAISQTARISALSVRASGKTAQEAIARADVTADATLNGLEMLRYRALVDAMSTNVSRADIKLASEEQALKSKLSALETRRQKLLRLHQEFPSQAMQSVAITDEALSKYLPISAQIVANTLDLDDVTEQLAALKRTQANNALIKAFVDEAQKLLSHEFVARQAIEQLLKTEAAMREKINKNDAARLLTMDSLRAQLLNSQAMNKAFIKETAAHINQATVPVKEATKGAWLGLALTLLLSLLFSIFKHARSTARLVRD
jgi:hypothetical protein